MSSHEQLLLHVLTVWFFASSIMIALLFALVLYYALGRAIGRKFRRRFQGRICYVRWYIWPDFKMRFRCRECWQAWHLQGLLPERWVGQSCVKHYPNPTGSINYYFSYEARVRIAIAADLRKILMEREAVAV
jgi:hypothetical protein